MPSPLIIKIQEREKEFYEKFRHCSCSLWLENGTPNNVESFHRATILAVLTELDREVWGLKSKDQDCQELEECLEEIGFNTALLLVRAKLSEAIKELGH